MADQRSDVSDDDQDIDIESDDDDNRSSIDSKDFGYDQSDKKAHHNALERKRRDHIKESFIGLRDCLPTMKRHAKASRAQILKQATDYIQFMTKKNGSIQKDIDSMKRQNQVLKQQVQVAERNGSAVLPSPYLRETTNDEIPDEQSFSSDCSDTELPLAVQPKRQKLSISQ